MTPPRIILAGGSGLLGRHLSRHFHTLGHEVIVLSRNPAAVVPHARTVLWDGRTAEGEWPSLLEGAQAVIGLAGKNVDCRYTPAARAEILESRVHSVAAIGAAIRRCTAPPRAWVQAVSLAIHGDAGDTLLTEETPPVFDCFSPRVCRAWEGATTAEALPDGVRKVLLRISFALAPDGGAMEPLRRLARWGLGGAAGRGRQHVSWIHIDDLCRMFEWAALRPDMEGLYNATSPEPLPNAAFMREIRRALGRPWSPPVPVWAIRLGAALIMRSEPELVLRSRRGIPKRFLDAGFSFQHPILRSAVEDVVGRKSKR